jgi:hypothetical protein
MPIELFIRTHNETLPVVAMRIGNLFANIDG